MTVSDTSVRAYRALTLDLVSRCQRQILDGMDFGRLYSRRELEKVANMRTGPVCGRVKELLEAGWLEVIGEKVCSESGKQVEALRLVALQLELC